MYNDRRCLILDVLSTCIYWSQEEGTYHFRTTFLVPEKETEEVAERLVKFHDSFMANYGKCEQ